MSETNLSKAIIFASWHLATTSLSGFGTEKNQVFLPEHCSNFQTEQVSPLFNQLCRCLLNHLEFHLFIQFLRRPVISMHVHVNLPHSCCHKRSILWMVEDRPTDPGNVREVKECYSLFYQFFLLIRAHN